MTLNLPLLVAAPLLFVWFAAPPYIRFLQRRYLGQYIREDGPQHHHSKAGTPTMGGLVILAAFVLGCLLATFLAPGFWTPSAGILLGVTLLFGGLGFVDDYLKIAKKENKGLSGYSKLAVQLLAGVLVGWYVMQQSGGGEVSFLGLAGFDLGWFYPVFAALVITGASNAVNLTDGLDGLAAGTSIPSFIALAVMLGGSAWGFQELSASHGPVSAETFSLAAAALVMLGACMGFLYHNRYPARVFMGDTGSLAIGGALGALAVLGHVEFWLLPVGAVFVAEALSVILQVLSFKTTGKRIFRMSPLHHHFELGGWHESKVVFHFISIQFLLCILAVFLYNRA